MAEFAGTIPPVRERPKVSKRSTIPVPLSLVRQPAKPELVQSEPAKPVQGSDVKALAARSAEENAPPRKPRMVVAPTMPSVKERPKVTRPSTINATAAAKAKPEGALAVTGTARVEKPQPAEKAAKPQESKGISWTSWLPLAAGIAIASVAPQLFALAGHWNPWGQRVLFPLVQLSGLHEIGMSDELTRTLPQLMLYLQFPLEGLLVASNMRRGMKFAKAMGPVPGLHFVCALVLWIVALGAVTLI